MYFGDIIGLSDVKQQLIRSVKEGIVPHARMFYGPEGVGKLPLAIAYARYLCCENRGETDACGKCPSCHKFNKLAHPDLHFVFPVVKSKVTDEYIADWRTFLSEHTYFNLNDWLEYINAENAQGLIYAKESEEIIKKLSLKVYEAPYKVMVVWLPEKMHESCANKLLKMIEEPPAQTVFLLVSEELDKVLGTIQSRCQPLHIRAIETEEMMDVLQSKQGLEHSTASWVTHIANGSYTKAMSLLTSQDDSNEYLELFQQMMRSSVMRNIKQIKEVSTMLSGIGREKQKSYLQYCLHLFREYFVYNLQTPQLNYLNQKESEFGVKFAPFIHAGNIEKLNDEFSMAYRQIEQNGNAKIIFLDLCLKVTMYLKK